MTTDRKESKEPCHEMKREKHTYTQKDSLDVLLKQGDMASQDTARWPEALGYYKQVEKYKPNDPHLLRRIGNILIKMRFLNEALPYLTQAIELMKPNAYLLALKQRAVIYFQLNLLPEALADFDEILKIKPLRLFELNMKASILESLEQLKKAFTCLKIIIENDPDNASPYRRAANILKKLGRDDEAIAYQSKASVLRKFDPRLALKVKQFEETKEKKANTLIPTEFSYSSIHTFDEAIQLGEEYELFAFSEEHTAFSNRAIDAYRIAESLNPRNPSPSTRIGEIFLGKRKFQDALDSFERADKLQPNDSYILERIGDTHCLPGSHFSNAIPFYQKSLKIKATPWVASKLGSLYFKNDQTEEAIEQFIVADSLYQTQRKRVFDIDVNLKLVRAYSKLNKNNLAISICNRILSYEKENADALFYKKKLEDIKKTQKSQKKEKKREERERMLIPLDRLVSTVRESKREKKEDDDPFSAITERKLEKLNTVFSHYSRSQIKYLRDGKGSPLISPAYLDQYTLEILRCLIKHGADGNATFYGLTLLHAAVIKNQLKVITLLIESNVNINCVAGNILPDYAQMTALYLATSYGSANALSLLIQAKANPFITPPGEPTILIVALQRLINQINILQRHHFLTYFQLTEDTEIKNIIKIIQLLLTYLGDDYVETHSNCGSKTALQYCLEIKNDKLATEIFSLLREKKIHDKNFVACLLPKNESYPGIMSVIVKETNEAGTALIKCARLESAAQYILAIQCCDTVLAKLYIETTISITYTALSKKAYSFLFLHKYDESLKYRQQSLSAARTKEEKIEAYLKISELYFIKQQPQLAIENANLALDLDRKKSQSYYTLFSIYRNQKEYKLCKQILQKTITLDKSDPSGYHNLAAEYSAQSDPESAMHYFAQSIQLGNLNSLIPAGKNCAINGDFHLALSILTYAHKNKYYGELMAWADATRSHQYETDILFYLAIVYFGLQQYEKSCEYYKLYFEKSHSKNLFVLYQYIDALIASNQKSEALNKLSDIMTAYPLPTVEYIVRYESLLPYHTRGRNREALLPQLSFGQLVSEGDLMSECYTQSSIILQYYQEALKSHPQNPTLLAKIGNLFCRMKNYKEAITFYKKSLSLYFDLSIALRLGRALMSSSLFEEAEAYFSWLVENKRYFCSEVHALWGDALFELRRYKEAGWCYEAAIQYEDIDMTIKEKIIIVNHFLAHPELPHQSLPKSNLFLSEIFKAFEQSKESKKESKVEMKTLPEETKRTSLPSMGFFKSSIYSGFSSFTRLHDTLAEKNELAYQLRLAAAGSADSKQTLEEVINNIMARFSERADRIYIINKQDEKRFRRNALHWAAKVGSFHRVTQLLATNLVDTSVKDADGKTAYDYTTVGNFDFPVEIIKQLTPESVNVELKIILTGHTHFPVRVTTELKPADEKTVTTLKRSF